MVHFGTVGYCILNLTLCPSVYPCFDVSIAMSGPQRRKYSRIKYADIQEGMTHGLQISMWTAGTLNEFLRVESYWIYDGWAEKAIAKVLFWQSFPLFSGAFPWKNGSITHPECTKTHCFEFEEAKLLWSFGLVRKAEFSLSFHGVFEVGISKKLVFVSTNLFFSFFTDFEKLGSENV